MRSGNRLAANGAARESRSPLMGVEMRRTHLAASVAVIAALITASSAVTAPPDVDSTRLEQLVTVPGITEHQQALQNIADMNGGTRATRTPGYTASAAYVKATLEEAGYNAHYEMFNMPEWQENAPPVLQQVAPTSKTYVPGSAADDNSPSVDFIAFEHSPTKSLTNVKVVPTNDIVIPSPGGTRSEEHTSELQSLRHLVCRLLLEKKKKEQDTTQ